MLVSFDRPKHRRQVSAGVGLRCRIMWRRGWCYVNLRPMRYELKPQEVELRGLQAARVKSIVKQQRRPKHPHMRRRLTRSSGGTLKLSMFPNRP